VEHGFASPGWDGGLPAPTPRPHAPGCPAAHTAAYQSKIAERNDSPLPSIAPLPTAFVPTADPATRSDDLPPPGQRLSHPPFYLAFRTFLI
jgi:hypothetical protein